MLKSIENTGSALEHLHNLEIAHNDVKPENILIFSREQAKLADFGFSECLCNMSRDLVKRWETRSLNCYTSPELVKFRSQLEEFD
jgi:serine/threonine protein kinase